MNDRHESWLGDYCACGYVLRTCGGCAEARCYSCDPFDAEAYDCDRKVIAERGGR